MDLTAIARLRLHNQHIAGGKLKTVKQLAAWMGALQAQDALMMKWAVGVRLPGLTERQVDAALDAGEILRTHVLRPTWHLVSPADISWMLALTAARIKASMQSRLRQLELTGDVISKSNALIQTALQDAEYLSRAELVALLNRAGIATTENRASHLIMHAELDGLICSSKLLRGRQTYALLEKRATASNLFSMDEALGRLAQVYFTSHGPATLKDFAWWSGLALGEATRGFEMVASSFTSETVDEITYYFSSHSRLPEQDDHAVHLLPPFDEFLISYADRRAVLPNGVSKRLVSDNGMFRPVVVVDGQVHGVWKRTIKKQQVFLEIEFFIQPPKKALAGLEAAAEQYAAFLEKELGELLRIPA